MRDKPQIKNAGVNMYTDATPIGKLNIFCDRNEKADTTQNTRSPIWSILFGQSLLIIHIIDITPTIP